MTAAVSLFLWFVGLPLTYAGWRLYEATILLLGAIVGLGVGFATGVLVVDPTTWPSAGPGLPAILGGLGSVCGIGVAYVAHRLAYALSGFAVVTLLAFAVTDTMWVAVLLGLGGGYLTWLVHKLSVIVLSALVGGLLVSLGVGVQDSAEAQLGLASLVAITGVLVQLGLFGEHTPEESPRRDPPQACPTCDTPCRDEDTYCQHCGAELSRCESCGRLGLATWTFCTDCGTTMERT